VPFQIVAKLNRSVCLDKVFADIMARSQTRVITLHPSKAVKLPDILKEQPPNIATVTDKAVVV